MLHGVANRLQPAPFIEVGHYVRAGMDGLPGPRHGLPFSSDATRFRRAPDCSGGQLAES